MPINIVENKCDICDEPVGEGEELWRLSSDTWACEDCFEYDIDAEDKTKINKIKRNTYSKRVSNKG